jgi:NADH-quinone oxidoreductase subunit I
MTDFASISLSGKKINVSRKEMTFSEKMYLPGIIKGMGITLKHFFRKKVTIQYPEVKREFSPVYRGQHILMRDENGAELGVLRVGCVRVACPAEAITMKAAERQKGEEHLYREEKYASTYEINMLRCIYCGLCEEACPKEAIFLTEQLVNPEYQRGGFIYGKEKLVMKPEQQVK